MKEFKTCINCKTKYEKKYKTDYIIIQRNGKIKLRLLFICPHCGTKYNIGMKEYKSIPQIERTDECTIEKQS